MQGKHVAYILGFLIFTAVTFFGIKKFVFSEEPSISGILSKQGYREIKPPSLLLPPGTWVKVRSELPLHLDIVCVSENALGSKSVKSVRDSNSIDIETTSKLSNTYQFDINTLKKLTAKSTFSEVESISFHLKNVRFVELPDEAVFSGVKERASQCDEAIRFWLNEGEPITMIKSVLIADAYYEVKYKKHVETDQKAKIAKKLALELGLKLEAQQHATNAIVGKNLIWGIRDDSKLARIGIGLPSTGGTETSETNIIPISNLASEDNYQPDAIIFSAPRKNLDDKVVSFDVNPIRQNSHMSCWATVYTMMKAWKENRDNLSLRDALSSLGEEWIDYYLFDKGLPGGLEKKFVRETGMLSRAPASYPLETYVEMMREHGPLWIITGDGLTSHAKLLVGIYGYETAPSINEYEDTTFEFIDPATGSYFYQSALDFTKNFEAEASWIVDKK